MSSFEDLDVNKPKLIVDKVISAVIDTSSYSPLRRSARLSRVASPIPSEDALLPKRRRRSSSAVSEDSNAASVKLCPRRSRLNPQEKISEEAEEVSTQPSQIESSPSKRLQIRHSSSPKQEPKAEIKTPTKNLSPRKQPQVKSLDKSMEEIVFGTEAEIELNTSTKPQQTTNEASSQSHLTDPQSLFKAKVDTTKDEIFEIILDDSSSEEKSESIIRAPEIPCITIEEVPSPCPDSSNLKEVEVITLSDDEEVITLSDDEESTPELESKNESKQSNSSEAQITTNDTSHDEKPSKESILPDAPNGPNTQDVKIQKPVGKENVKSSGFQKKAEDLALGRRESKRFWKSSRDRFKSTIKSKGLKQNLKQRLEQKESLRRAKELEKALKDAKRSEQEELRRRQELNKKRREENAKKTEVVQLVKNPAKIKRMKKKQLRQFVKRDVTVVQK